MEWEDLQQYNREMMVKYIFTRTSYIQKLYDISMCGKNQYEYICNNIIKDNLYVIVKNMYPYDIAENIEHSIIWFNPIYYSKWRRTIIYDNNYIEKIINNKVGGKSYIYFMNSGKFQSIGSISHIHLLVKEY